MSQRIVQVYYGSGKGKTSAAVGQCIRAAGLGQSVIIIQFLKGKDAEEFSFLNRPGSRILNCFGLKERMNLMIVC